MDPATGVLSVLTDRLRAGLVVTIIARQPGGEESRFKLTLAAAEDAPAVVTAPKLSGNGKIGLAVTVDAGTWSGQPARPRRCSGSATAPTSAAPPGRATPQWRRTTAPR